MSALSNRPAPTGPRDEEPVENVPVNVSDTEDFSMVIGHRVQIEGKVADREHGKVEIKSETKIDGPGKDTYSEAEGSGAYLGVKHMKTIAASCP